MPDFTRNDGVPPPLPDSDGKSAKLFSHGLEPLPEKGPAIVVVVGDWCGHCQAMEMNNYTAPDMNNDTTQTQKGTPVRWMNIAYREVYDQLANIPGVSYKDHHFEVNGAIISNLPTVIEIVDGKAVQLSSGAGPLTNKGSLDKIDNHIGAQIKAQDQAREAVGDSCKLDTATACVADPKAAPITGLDMKKSVEQQDPGPNR